MLPEGTQQIHMILLSHFVLILSTAPNIWQIWMICIDQHIVIVKTSDEIQRWSVFDLHTF